MISAGSLNIFWQVSSKINNYQKHEAEVKLNKHRNLQEAFKENGKAVDNFSVGCLRIK